MPESSQELERAVYCLDEMICPASEGIQKYTGMPKDLLRFPDLSQQPQKCFTWDEVSAFNGRGGASLCLVVDSNVYNVTEYLQYHPGGPGHLKQLAGTDASTPAHASGMPAYVFTHLMQRFLIGYVVERGATC